MTTDGTAEGRRLRDEGMAQVAEHHTDRLKRQWLDVIHAVAMRHDAFTTDQVVELGTQIGLDEPREGRLFGPLMQSAARHGWIVKVNATRPSNRPRLHAQPQQVWMSALRGATVETCQHCAGQGVRVVAARETMDNLTLFGEER